MSQRRAKKLRKELKDLGVEVKNTGYSIRESGKVTASVERGYYQYMKKLRRG